MITRPALRFFSFANSFSKVRNVSDWQVTFHSPAMRMSCCRSARFSCQASINWKYLQHIFKINLKNKRVFFFKHNFNPIVWSILFWGSLFIYYFSYLNSVSLCHSVSTGWFLRSVRFAWTVVIQSRKFNIKFCQKGKFQTPQKWGGCVGGEGRVKPSSV